MNFTSSFPSGTVLFRLPLVVSAYRRWSGTPHRGHVQLNLRLGCEEPCALVWIDQPCANRMPFMMSGFNHSLTYCAREVVGIAGS
jgi:hypothetical protein